MTAKGTISYDYLDAINCIKKRRKKGLTIFIVDKDLFYKKLLSNILSDNPRFDVYTFSFGEEYLMYASFNPDLVIFVSNHTEEQDVNLKIDSIAQEIAKKVPSADVVLFSVNDKLAFVEGLHAIDTLKISL